MRYLKKGTFKYRISVGAPVYMAAVIEYLAGNSSIEGPHRQVSFTLGQAAVNLPIPASKILPDNSRAFPGLLGQGWLLKALGK